MSSASSVPSNSAAGSADTTQSATATPTPGTSLFGAPRPSVQYPFGTPNAPAPTATTSLFGSNTLGSAATSTQSATATPIAGISLFGAPGPSQPSFETPTASSPVATLSSSGSNTSGSTATSTQSSPFSCKIGSAQLVGAALKKTISIVEDGDCDTLLEVSNGKTTKRYQVNSIFLTTHSVVFKKMLARDSNFSEAAAVRDAQTTGKPALITLEDDPNVMEFILYALHSKYSKVPRKLSLAHLTQAAIICDKYCLHEALSSISEHWISLGTERSVVHPTEWLYISWVFGPESVFTSTSRNIILKSVYASDGHTLVLGYDLFYRPKTLLEETPEIIASSLRLRRSEYLAGVQNSLENLRKRYSGQEVSPSRATAVFCIADKEYCDAMQMGIIYRFLAKYESKKFQDYSISKLYSLIEKLPSDWVIPFDTHGFGSPSHASCSWIPAFITEHKKAMEDTKGLTFSEFPSRKWC
ncbi:hypothetical protein BZA77DRAFT_323518 [Pyronema omphalodes]|nr:hypothetical protein BZA77DRAFT_323518 [Pyronema omphalodes]